MSMTVSTIDRGLVGLGLVLGLGACQSTADFESSGGPEPWTGTGGVSSASETGLDPEITESDSTADGTSGDESTVTEGTETGIDGCPEPTVPPVFAGEDLESWCPDGFDHDSAYDLCAGESMARGPFTDAMIDACEDCGHAACDDEDWPVDLARGLRGTGVCPPGAALSDEGLCVDEQFAWGPFTAAMVEQCDAAGGGGACSSMRWDRGFAESMLPAAPLDGPWGYIMPLDYGVREDGYGGGHFGAPRSGNPGGHSGIDFLAPVGTPLLAPCDGPVWAGYASGYGNYVQLACPIPDEIAQGADLYASLFFAHLETLSVDSGASVVAGQQVGTVGKSGNASAGGINAHVHFEMVIHGSEAAALAEAHASSNHSGNAAGDQFGALIEQHCWGPNDLVSLTGPSMKGRRPDPFMALACMVGEKPTLTSPPGGLQPYLVSWSDHYDATGFDVDE